jgi:UDP-N-acetylmuramate--alanine ligase
MTTLKDIQEVYLIGIGGIGMSALARYFHERGAKVSGYDRSPSPLTATLQSEGIPVHYADDPGLAASRPDLVIYTPAVPAGHTELTHYRDRGFPVLKRSQVLGMISRELFCITVAGTHGKTTTSTLIAHILRESGYGCNAFLGGISLNYDTNFWSNERGVAVIEADEYDRSFLQLEPDIAVLTAMDADHLDIYGTEDVLRDAFVDYTRQIRPGGTLVYKQGLPRTGEMGGEQKIAYSLAEETADCYAGDIRVVDGGYAFSIKGPAWKVDDVVLHSGGLHNVENAVAAVTVAHHLAIPPEQIKKALASFRGIQRRFQYLIRTDRLVYIDDYAHHPEELKALIRGAKALFPQKHCTVIFQPHLYSRTKDMAAAFARVLDEAATVILLPVYGAREAPVPGVDSGVIAKEMTLKEIHVLDKAATLAWLKTHPQEVLITAGAGDIGGMTAEISALLGADPGNGAANKGV